MNHIFTFFYLERKKHKEESEELQTKNLPIISLQLTDKRWMDIERETVKCNVHLYSHRR